VIQRRLYLYIVAGASLAMLLVGLSNLGTTAIDQVLGTGGPAPSPRDAYAGFGAMTLVGLPVFVLHWGIAQRLSARHAEERASSLRRLYLYLAMAAIAIALTVFLRRLLEAGFAAVGGSAPVTDAIAGSAWISIVLLAFWLYHLRVAAQDRLAVGEEGAGATLRRWYSYGLLLLGLALLLFGAQGLLQQLWVLLVDRQHTLSAGGGIASALATTLIGLAVWTFHSLLTGSSSIAEDDRPSTLRAVAGFLALAVSVLLALVGASRLLYYALARALGVAHPGGVGDDLLVAVAAPGSAVIVFGFAWVWLRAQLARDAGEVEGPRRSGVRRVYTHLVAFLALATLAVGAAGLLWTLSDQLLTPLTGLTAGEWRDRTSLFITLAVVGTPMWMLHWRPSPPAVERQALSRRLYLYASLLGSVLALLASGATLVYRLLGILLNASTAASGAAVVDIGRATSVIAVAAALGLYHWRVLGRDGAARPAEAPDLPSQPAAISIEVRGAAEEQVRRLLQGLPDGATYSIRRLPG